MLDGKFDSLGEASRLVSPKAQSHFVEMCLAHYEVAFSMSERAQDYLCRQRRLSTKICKTFNVGFCDRTLSKELPNAELFEGAMIRGTLQRFGFIKPNGRELFRGCITVPIHDEYGQLIDVYGRKISDNQRRGVSLRLSIHGKAVSFFNAATLKCCKEVIICSTPLEALSLLSCGVKNVVSAVGIESFSLALAQQLVSNDVERVIFAFANRISTRKYKELFKKALRQLGIESHEIQLPVGEDINSSLVKSEFLAELCGQLEIKRPRRLLCH